MVGPCRASPYLVRGGEKIGVVLLLLGIVRVQQALVAVAAAPHDEILAAELLGHVEALFHLSGSHAHRSHLWVCRAAVHEALVREKVARSPKQLHPGLLLLRKQLIRDHVEHLLGLRDRRSLGRYIAVVKAIILDAEQTAKLEVHVDAV